MYCEGASLLGVTVRLALPIHLVDAVMICQRTLLKKGGLGKQGTSSTSVGLGLSCCRSVAVGWPLIMIRLGAGIDLGETRSGEELPSCQQYRRRSCMLGMVTF